MMTPQSSKTDDFQDSVLTMFERFELFRALSEEDRIQMASMCRVKHYEKRSFLFHEGNPADAAFLLVKGQVQLSRQTETGREIVIATVHPVRLFAEVVLFEATSYPVTASAVTRVEVIRIPRRGFVNLIDANPGFRHRFIGLLMKRQRYLTERVRYLTLYDLEERLFSYLKLHYGAQNIIRPGISRKDMAAAIGATPESLSRLLKRLKDEGTLVWDGNRIVIRAFPHLSGE